MKKLELLKKSFKVIAYLFVFITFLSLLIYSLREISKDRDLKKLAKKHIKIGDELFEKRNFIASLAAYNYANGLLPGDMELNIKILKSRLFLIAERPDLITIDRIEDLLHELRFMMKEDKKNEATYMAANAQILFRTGDNEGAKLKFKNALEIDKNNIGAYLGLALIYSGDDNTLNDAMKEVKTALEIQPDHSYALTLLSSFYLRTGDFEKSIETGEKALAQKDDFNLRLILGRAYLRKGDQREAEKNFLRAKALNPQASDPDIDLSEVYFTTQKFAEAENSIRMAIAKQNQLQSNVNILYRLAVSLSRQGKFKDAISIFDQLLASMPTNHSVIFESAIAYEGNNEKEKALSLYKNFTTLSPMEDQSLRDWYNQALAQVKAKIRQIEGATSQ